MRYAILSDIHSNLEALQAVLEHLRAQGGADALWCLGDIVGYGPDPEECLRVLRELEALTIAGNHDWAATGDVDTSYFNPDAASAAHWTAAQLTAESLEYLKTLPLTLRQEPFTLVHGSPRDPIWEYVVSQSIAQANFPLFNTPYCLVGHSHVPLVFRLESASGRATLMELPQEAPLKMGAERLIINPGGVGQPRDGDPRASYAVYASKEMAIYHFRVPYDIATTQQKMRRLGLPPRLAQRLSYGR